MPAYRTRLLSLLTVLFLCTHLHTVGSIRAKRVDDTSITSLEAVVEQLSDQVQVQQATLQAQQNRLDAVESQNTALQSEVANLQTRLALLSRTVAFTVHFTQDDAIHGIGIGNHAPLRFDGVNLNAGNGYDPQTGIFTAPLPGTYSFFLTQMGAGGSGTAFLAIAKHGAILDIVYSKDHEDQGSTQITVHLVSGDEIWVQHWSGVGVRGGWYTVFTGYLLQAD